MIWCVFKFAWKISIFSDFPSGFLCYIFSRLLRWWIVYLSCSLFGSLGLPREVVEPMSCGWNAPGNDQLTYPTFHGKVGTSSTQKHAFRWRGDMLYNSLDGVIFFLILYVYLTILPSLSTSPDGAVEVLLIFCFEKRMLTIAIYQLIISLHRFIEIYWDYNEQVDE